MNLGYSFNSNVLPDYIYEGDLSLSSAIGIALTVIGGVLLLTGSLWLAVWYIRERRQADFDYLLPGLQELSVSSSCLIGLLIFPITFFLINLAFDTGGLAYPLFLPSWLGFIIAILSGLVVCALVLLIGMAVRSKKSEL